MSNRVGFSKRALVVSAARAFVFLTWELLYSGKSYKSILDRYIISLYNKNMKKKKRGRPPKAEDELHSESLLVRLDSNEKQAFKDAAALAGVSLSSWARERLRQMATRELKSAAQPIAFLKQLAHD